MQYNQTTVAFTELSNSEVATALKECEPHRQCISCGLERLRDQSAQWTAVPGRGLMCHGIRYHLLDYVYLNLSQTGDDLLHIAQIREFTISPEGESPTATVRLLGRFSDVAECSGFDRSRRTLKVDQVHSLLSHNQITNVCAYICSYSMISFILTHCWLELMLIVLRARYTFVTLEPCLLDFINLGLSLMTTLL